MESRTIGIGDQIKKLRIQGGYTQQDLADKLNVTRSIISAYEKDKRAPSYGKLIELAVLFDVSTDYLLGVNAGQSLDLSGLTKDERLAVATLVKTMR